MSLTSTFPRSHRKTSRLGFGGAAMGLTNYLGRYDAAKRRDMSLAAVHRAVEHGITYFDTAPGYGNGLCEEIMGEALERAPNITACAARVSICCRSTTADSMMRPWRSFWPRVAWWISWYGCARKAL